MARLTNYHTHTKYCRHAKGVVEDYVLKAIELKMSELGMSDHNPVDVNHYLALNMDHQIIHSYMDYDTFVNKYLKEAYAAKEKYRNQIKIFVGAECEYDKDNHEYYKKLHEQLDYMILGLHQYVSNGKIISSFGDINYENVDDYAKTCIEAMNTGFYRIFAHPTVFFCGYKDENNERKWNDHLSYLCRLMIEAAIKNHVAIELNVNGFRNSLSWGFNLDELRYPNYQFFEILKEYPEAEVVLGLDAHFPEYLNDKYIDMALEYAKKYNIKLLDRIDIIR